MLSSEQIEKKIKELFDAEKMLAAATCRMERGPERDQLVNNLEEIQGALYALRWATGAYYFPRRMQLRMVRRKIEAARKTT